MATHSSIPAWEIHGQGSLVGDSPWGRQELDTTQRLNNPLNHSPSWLNFFKISPLYAFPVTVLLLTHLQFICLPNKSLQLLSLGSLTSLMVKTNNPVNAFLSFDISMHLSC